MIKLIGKSESRGEQVCTAFVKFTVQNIVTSLMLFYMYESLMSLKIVANDAHTVFKMHLTSLHTLFTVFFF